MAQTVNARNRMKLIACAAGIMVVGLASRKCSAIFPAVFGKYPGDVLWAMMVYLGWAILLPRKPIKILAFLALITAYAIEFSQLYKAPWIDALRSTTIGYLVLGTTFSWWDICAYTVGIALIMILETMLYGLKYVGWSGQASGLNGMVSRCVGRRFAMGYLLATCSTACIVVILHAESVVHQAAEGHLFERAEDVDLQRAILVLGTTPEVDGKPNYYFNERLQATARLWKHDNKARSILVSGDGSRDDYNEPARMKEGLVRLGVPANAIECDLAGNRTLNSILRAKQKFGLTKVVIVSQREHLERALYLANAAGLDAQGLVANDAPYWWQVRQHLRETLARVQAVFDVSFNKLHASIIAS